VVLPDSHKISRVSWYSGTHINITQDFVYGAITLYGSSFQNLPLSLHVYIREPYNPLPKAGFGLFRFRSPLLTESRLIFFLPVTLDVSVRWLTSTHPIDSGGSLRGFSSEGFPHSEIPGYNGSWRLPETYRNLVRPSSAFKSKSSIVCF
jgi:hypothetical protein